MGRDRQTDSFEFDLGHEPTWVGLTLKAVTLNTSPERQNIQGLSV